MAQSLFDLFIRPLLNGGLFDEARDRQVSYDELFADERDGTARYDDVWGAPCHLEDERDR